MPKKISNSIYSVAVSRKCSVKKVFLKISQNSQENTWARASFLMRPATLLKKSPWHRYFPVNFTKFLRTSFSQNISGWLLLYIWRYTFDLLKNFIISIIFWQRKVQASLYVDCIHFKDKSKLAVLTVENYERKKYLNRLVYKSISLWFGNWWSAAFSSWFGHNLKWIFYWWWDNHIWLWNVYVP